MIQNARRVRPPAPKRAPDDPKHLAVNWINAQRQKHLPGVWAPAFARAFRCGFAAAKRVLKKNASVVQSDLDQARETVRAILATENKTLHCAYCGQAYPKGTPESKHQRLAAHILECPRHPMPALLAACKAFVASYSKTGEFNTHTAEHSPAELREMAQAAIANAKALKGSAS